MKENKEEFHTLSYYTLAHPDQVYFIHQHVVDAYQAQTADEETRPIGIVFSLLGLYLFLEKGYSGRQVQKAHMILARNKKPWSLQALPDQRGEVTILDVLNAKEGQPRDEMIEVWCRSVWAAYSEWHPMIRTLAGEDLGVD